MALYAFDGTWQHDYADGEQDTNVVKFRDAYAAGNVFYVAGVGTRFGWLGAAIGAFTGAGGRRRIREGLDAFAKHQAAGDRAVDIVGFSRGAALALHFANSLPQGTAVRFLGLFDTVPSFGIPGNNIDLGWRLGLAPGVERCFHAMALHETRYNFPLHRPEPCGQLTEVWFRGVHSDVGGGNGNGALSSIALDWMFCAAKRSGMEMSPAKLAENRQRMDASAHISTLKFTSKLHPRKPRPGDSIHASVSRLLKKGVQRV